MSRVCSYQSVLGGSTVTFMQQRTVVTFAKFKVSQSRRLKGHDVTFQAASIFVLFGLIFIFGIHTPFIAFFWPKLLSSLGKK